MGWEELFERIKSALAELKLEETVEYVRKAVEAGVKPYDVIMKGLTPGLEVVGRKYEEGEYFLSELIFAAHIMNEAMSVLNPLLERELAEGGVKVRGTVVLGTVKGDIHNIGKNIAAALFRGAGFRVIDLGEDVPAEKFVEAVERYRADILGMSALLSTTAPYFKVVIDKLRERGLRDRVFVIIGGAVVDEELAKESGADAWCRDAALGVRMALEYVEGRSKRSQKP